MHRFTHREVFGAMANIKQQKKRIGIAQRQRMENLRYRSTIKTLFNRLQLAVDTGDRDTATATHRELVKLLDRAVTRGVFHRNTAARKKSRAERILLQEAKTDASTIRKAKKKATPARKPKAEAKKPAAKKPVTKKSEATDEAKSEPATDAPAADPVAETNADEATDATPAADTEPSTE